MQLKFNHTTWHKEKVVHDLFVISNVDRMGVCISLIVAEKNIDTVLLKINIKKKSDLHLFWMMMHIAGIMSNNDSNHTGEFIQIVEDMMGETINNQQAHLYIQQLQKHGRDLWELLGKSNLMFLLS